MDEPESLEPPRTPVQVRLRRVGRAALAPLRALLFPSRSVAPLVTAGRYQLAMLITVGAALLSAYAVGSRLDMAPAVQAMNAGPPHMGGGQPPGPVKTDREIEEQIEKVTAVTRVKLGLEAGLLTPFEILALGIGLLLLGKYVGGRPSMRASMAAAAVGSLPWAVKSLITAAAAFRQGVVQPQHLGKLVSAGLPWTPGNPLLARLLAGVDLFTVWSVVLLGFGFAAATEMRRRRAFVALVAATLLYLLVTQVILAGPPHPPHPPPGAPHGAH